MKYDHITYLMNANYNILLKDDIDNFSLMPIQNSHTKIHYMGDKIVVVVYDDNTSRIIKKYTIDDNENKCTYFDNPSEIDYNSHGKVSIIKYQPIKNNGEPDIITVDYNKETNEPEHNYYWTNSNGVIQNAEFNDFFNHFFIEKLFDITVDYDGSDIIKLIISFILKGKEQDIISTFKQLNITSLDHIQKEYVNLVEILQD